MTAKTVAVTAGLLEIAFLCWYVPAAIKLRKRQLRMDKEFRELQCRIRNRSTR